MTIMEDTQDSDKQPNHNKKRHTITFVTFAQSIFLTTKFFLRNRLLSYASACSFSLLFSFIPIFMMILVILIRLLHASPEMISTLLTFAPQISSYLNERSIISSILSVHKIGIFEVVIGISIFWMARRLFASVMDSMQCIFHTAHQRKPWFNQIVTLLVEVSIVIVIAVVVFAFMSLKTSLSMTQFDQVFSHIPGLRRTLTNKLFNQLPNILMLILITTLYRTEPGTKPPLVLCLFSAAACTFVFWIVRLIMHAFINMSTYNLIYGVLGRLIVILLEVFMFFMLFLIFAQFIFVCQFFDELLIGELYTLPKRDTPGFASLFRRTLFVRPDYLMAQDVHLLQLKKGDIIFTPADTGTDAYYVVRGTIEDARKDSTVKYEKGDFFGELACILAKPRDGTAVAATDAEIVRIDGDTFRQLTSHNPDVASKALGQISSYFTKVYGRTDGFLL